MSPFADELRVVYVSIEVLHQKKKVLYRVYSNITPIKTSCYEK